MHWVPTAAAAAWLERNLLGRFKQGEQEEPLSCYESPVGASCPTERPTEVAGFCWLRSGRLQLKPPRDAAPPVFDCWQQISLVLLRKSPSGSLRVWAVVKMKKRKSVDFWLWRVLSSLQSQFNQMTIECFSSDFLPSFIRWWVVP